jgi:hypothetical protein
MNYGEDKLIRIGQDLSSMLKSPVLVEDRREASHVLHYLFENGNIYNDLPAVGGKHEGKCRLEKNGDIIFHPLKNAQIIQNNLMQKRYRSVAAGENILVMPLIDDRMPEDVEGLIRPVDRFYYSIKARQIHAYAGIDEELLAEISHATDEERKNARKGLVEHYMGEKTILNTLKRVGFVDIKPKHHETEPFYNITARKP